jgi:hypothetical protein
MNIAIIQSIKDKKKFQKILYLLSKVRGIYNVLKMHVLNSSSFY